MLSFHVRHFAFSKLSFARFIWKPHKADQESKHITMNSNKLKKENCRGNPALEAFWSSFYIEEETDAEHPFYGLINAARTSQGRKGQIYISIRTPADNLEEARSEMETMKGSEVVGSDAY